MKAILTGLTLFGSTAAWSAMPLPALAQEAGTPPSAVCMARQSDAPGGQLLVIVVPMGGQEAMAARGFSPYACDEDPDAFASYRTKICELAEKAPTALLDQFTQANNVSPGELCDMANSVSGTVL